MPPSLPPETSMMTIAFNLCLVIEINVPQLDKQTQELQQMLPVLSIH